MKQPTHWYILVTVGESKLIKKYNIQQKKSKALELIGQGLTYNQIAEQIGVSRQFVMDALKEELASATTPEKILELRQHQTETLSSHTPKLTKRFLQQSSLTERLANKYEQYLDEDDQGLYTYSYLHDMYIMEGFDEEQANLNTKRDIAEYREKRETIAREMERTAKLGDQHYMTLLKHNERLAKLQGLDMPAQQNILIHRSDEVKISLAEDIKRTQQQIEASQPVIEAEVVENDG